MELRIDTTKTIEENATFYYDKSKKAKSKVEGLNKAIKVSEKKLKFMEEEEKKPKIEYKKPPELKWYMKYRWFISSDGFLCIGGRDATTNEVIVKKYTEKGDLVFHTDIVGSPFFVVKAEGKEVPEQTIIETANATASFSRAWREGYVNTEVYHIKPDQVKKDFGLPKGSFMIHGKRTYNTGIVKLYVKKDENEYLQCTPLKGEFELEQGGKKSDTAKKIQKLLIDKYGIKYSLDEINRILPNDCSLVKS